MDQKLISRVRIRMNELGAKKIPFFFIFDFKLNAPQVYLLDEVQQAGYQFRFHEGSPIASVLSPIPNVTAPIDHALVMHSEAYPFIQYQNQFDQVVSHIKAGDSFLINLTCSTPVSINATLKDFYNRVSSKYVLLKEADFLVFSPETFVQIQQGIIASCPMKGTIDASLPNAASLLLNNPKEAAEHATIVDLIRNDLSMVSHQVQVEKYRYLDEIQAGDKRLLQASSLITGHLSKHYCSQIGDILLALLPAGSICGAPKKRTLEIIRSVETHERGFYTGIFGIFDGENLDSAVMIRFIEQTPQGYVYKSGGGITAFSNVNDEYQELMQKVYVPVC